MNTSYVSETIVRQRMEQTAKTARTAHQRHTVKVRPGWHFPKVTFPARRRTFAPRPA